MTQIQVINIKRQITGYIEVSYKMTFTLPAIFGTGLNPIEGLSKIVQSYSDRYSIEVIPVIGIVMVVNETKSPDINLSVPQIKTFLQGRYSALRTEIDGLTLTNFDSLAGLSYDGSAWTSTALITDTPIIQDQTNLGVTATGIAGAAVTLTLPAVIGKFHNISHLSITAYSTAARVGGATPVIVTTTNLLNIPAFTFASAGAVGTTDIKTVEPTLPIKSSVSNTATTVVCPATVSIIWRVQIFYSTSI